MNEKEKLTSEECIEKRLAEMLKADMDKVPEVHITADELAAWVKDDNAKRRKRFMKRMGIAAVFVLVCVTVLFGMWPGRTVPVGADKDMNVHMGENAENAIISGNNASTNYMDNIRVETDWKKVSALSTKVNNLCIPQYCPENFKFDEVTLDVENKDLFKAEYCFNGENGSILKIKQYKINGAGEKTTYFKNKNKIKSLDTSKGEAVLYMDNEKAFKATIVIQNSTIMIAAEDFDLPEKEYKNIIDNLEIID